MSFIELHQISKSFSDGAGQERKVLDRLDLRLESGDYLAITGVSGAGKSTLLNILGTLMMPDKGSYLFDGQTVDGERTDLLQMRNRRIGFVFQEHRLFPQFTVRQNILMPVLAYEKTVGEAEENYAWQLMERMGIASLGDRLPGTLSGGEKSRTALCRALMNRPALLLADEPTGQLDSGRAKEVAELFHRINEDFGTTIVLVTHADELAATAPKRHELKEGRLQ